MACPSRVGISVFFVFSIVSCASLSPDSPHEPTFFPALAEPPCSISKGEQARLLRTQYQQAPALTGESAELDEIFLTNYCASFLRASRFMRAARIRLQQQYPALSDEEIDILATQELEADGAQRAHDRWVRDQRLLEPSLRLSCTSTQLGASTLMDCY